MSKEIAGQIATEAPTDPEILSRLQNDYGVRRDALDRMQHTHQMVIGMGYDDLQVMLDMSRPEPINPVGALHDGSPAYQTTFEKNYDQVRHNPLEKLEFDSRYVDEFLRKLGPTNSLRRPDGLDGSFELARIRRLLQNDYEALPESQKRLELRRTEALINEELALLWLPDAGVDVEQAPEELRPLIANPDDVNVENIFQANPSAGDRWKLVGAHLSAEAAELFQAIANSPTATTGEKLEATCRATDMEIRRLSILAGMDNNGGQKRLLYKQIGELADATMHTMVDAWLDPDVRREVRKGKLFELLVVVDERRKLMQAGVRRQLVRLALPREDEVHERIGMVSKGPEKINLSSDVIVENINTGRFVTSYQAKAMTPEEYDAEVDKEVARGRSEEVHDSGRIVMRFLDEEELPVLAGRS